MNIFEKTDFTGDKPSVVSIKKSEKVNLFTVGLSEKQVLAKHITTIPATLVLIRGKVDFNISGETVVLRDGDVYEIPVNVEHEVVGRDIENLLLKAILLREHIRSRELIFLPLYLLLAKNTLQ